MWTQQFGVYSFLSYFKLRFVFDEIIHWIYDPSRINLRSLWCTYFGQLSSWSKSRRRITGLSTINWGQQMCGENHLCCVIEVFESWSPKPTSFLTRCYVWEASVQNQFKPGKTKLNCIWKHAISRNWIQLTENQWNSSWKFPRIYYIVNYHWDSEDDAELKCEPWAIF